MKNISTKTVGMIQVALFAALIIIMSATPLGYIPLGFMRATIIHIPVILGSVLLGPKLGAALGFIFGLTSFVNNTINPLITSFVFTPFYSLGEFKGGFGSIVICFLPRILVGVFPYFVFQALQFVFKKKQAGQTIALGIAGIVGSLTNTVLVMSLIVVFFKDSYAAAQNVSPEAISAVIISVIAINGVVEAIIAAVIIAFVGHVLLSKRFARS